MKELLLWLIGLQKVDQTESALYIGIQNDEIIGKSAADVLNALLLMDSVEGAETSARTSGGLRTIRAIYYALQILKNLSNTEELQNLAKLEYPYQHLVEKGKLLDEQFEKEIASSKFVKFESHPTGEDELEDEETDDFEEDEDSNGDDS